MAKMADPIVDSNVTLIALSCVFWSPDHLEHFFGYVVQESAGTWSPAKLLKTYQKRVTL